MKESNLNSNSNFKTQRWDALEATDNEARETGTKVLQQFAWRHTSHRYSTDPQRNDGTGLDLFSGQN